MKKKDEKSGANWRRLDNAAKIFPSNTKKEDTKVFRFSCELMEPVESRILQLAVYDTVRENPFFQSVLKRGVFWYYMEESDIDPVVRLEDRVPCSMLYDQSAKRLLFEVSYYRCRINLEVFHGLTDGTGALYFLRSLVCFYLSRKEKDSLGDKRITLGDNGSQAQRMADSFQKYYDDSREYAKKPPKDGKPTGSKPGTKAEKGLKRRVYKLHGVKAPEGRLMIFEGQTDSAKLLETARTYHTTVTVFLAAALILAIAEEMPVRKKKHPVAVSIPVNLRKYFPSETVRNFFGVVNASYCFAEGSGALEDVIRSFGQELSDGLGEEKLKERLDRMSALEHSVVNRLLPLFLKDWILRFFYWRSEKEYTTTLSNLGRVDMPEALAPFIRMFDVFNSTSDLQICTVSFGGKMNLSMTSRFASTEIPKNFFRILAGMGLDLTVVTNVLEVEA